MKTLAVFSSVSNLIRALDARRATTKQAKQTNATHMSDIDNDNDSIDNLGLNISLGDVDTANPFIGAGKWPMEIASVAVKPGSKNKTHKYLTLQLKNIDTVTGSQGQDIPAGQISAWYRLGLQQIEGAFDFRKDLAKLSDAAFGERRDFGSEFIADLQGKVVLARFAESKDKTFGDTEVKGVEAYANA